MRIITVLRGAQLNEALRSCGVPGSNTKMGFMVVARFGESVITCTFQEDTVGAAIRAERKRRGLTQEEVGLKLRRRQPTISKIESGKYEFDPQEPWYISEEAVHWLLQSRLESATPSEVSKARDQQVNEGD